MIGGLALVPQIADRSSVPVIAAVAIMDGRGVAASLSRRLPAAELVAELVRETEAELRRLGELAG